MPGKKKHAGGENIRVVIRVRDLLPKEVQAGDKQAVRMDLAGSQVVVNHAIGDPDVWAFDGVYNNTYAQRDIYLQEVQPLVDAVLQGYNATVFAYGQSGSGKTYTMTGNLKQPELRGMMPQCVEQLFNEVKKQTSQTKNFKVKVSYVELYLGKSRDLLSGKHENLEIKQNMAKNFYVKGAETVEVLGAEDCYRLFEKGTANRETASTGLNDTSSRSHALFMMAVEQHDFEQDPSAPIIMTSKINIVDLAGSEKLSKTNAQGDTAKEGCQINLSLSSLATVIDTIVKGGKHIPYRSSSLTMLLKDSLGGNSKTVMFANIGPSDQNVSETISTLRFAERAKQIENKPIKNLDPKDARIQELLEKIEELQKRLGNVDLNEEDRLQQRIEELEVENAQLRGGGEKDLLAMQEDIKVKEAEIQQLIDGMKVKEKELQNAKEASEIMESNFRSDLELMNELKSITANFLRRVCSEDQLNLIHSKMPIDVVQESQEQGGGAHGQWSVREIQFYLEGFMDLYEDWRRTVYTEDEFKVKMQRVRDEVTDQFRLDVENITVERDAMLRAREDEVKTRTQSNEETSHLKVDFTNLKEENAKLKDKVERDQEKWKKRVEKLREEQKKAMDEGEQVRSELTQREREVEKMKKMLEEAGSKGGLTHTGSFYGGTSPNKGGAGGGASSEEMEALKLKNARLEAHARESTLLLRRKGIQLKPNEMAAHGIPQAPDGDTPSAPDANNDAFIITNFDDEDPIDADIVTQLQLQLRVQHRLHELRHSHQRKLEDLIRKYELLKTGQVTATASVVSEGSISEEALAIKVAEATAQKDEEMANMKAEHEKITDKLVSKINKKLQEFKEKESVWAEEKGALEEERGELVAHTEELTRYNTQMQVDVENLRTQLSNVRSEVQGDVRVKDDEIAHQKHYIEEMKQTIEQYKFKMDEYQDLQQTHKKLSDQYNRSEGTVKEKVVALDNARQMNKWQQNVIETEKRKVQELDEALNKAKEHYAEKEDNWRQQLIENANKLVAINNKRLEEQAAQYQTLLTEEKEKQQAVREKLKKAKAQTAKAEQRYDEMVLENENLQTQFEELKVSAMKLYRERQNAEAEAYMVRGGNNAQKRF